MPHVSANTTIFDADDYTYYLPREIGSSPSPRSCSIELSSADTGKLSGRAEITSCQKGRLWSVTVRSSGSDRQHNMATLDSNRPKDLPTNGYTTRANEDFPVQIDDISNTLSEIIFDMESPTTGLVVVSGATNSAKSIVTRALISQYLNDDRWLGKKMRSSKRRPHLVTYEDPIEALYYDHTKTADSFGVDYTPQEAESDRTSLAKSLLSAKRQSPSVFYIGEVRSAADWLPIIEFAATGHLVITTSHAASLAEAFNRILRSISAKEPTERRYAAQQIRAIVHQIPIRSNDTLVQVPSVWRNNHRGVSSMISEGLSSILPSSNLANIEDQYCFGRTAMLELLLRKKDDATRNTLLRELSPITRDCDLQGR